MPLQHTHPPGDGGLRCGNCGHFPTAVELLHYRRCSFCGSDLMSSLREYNRLINAPPTGPAAPVLHLAQNYLVDELWDLAQTHASTAIKIDSTYYLGYLYLLMAQMHVCYIVDLQFVTQSFECCSSYLMFRRFAPELFLVEIDYYLYLVKQRVDGNSAPPTQWDDVPPDDYDVHGYSDVCDYEQAYSDSEEIYQEACRLHSSAVTYRDFRHAAESFGTIPHYKDADDRYSVCSRMYSNMQTEAVMKNMVKGGLVFSFFLLALKVLVGGI